jgi:hypothetical protein
MRGENRKRLDDVNQRDEQIRSRIPVSGERDILTVYGKDPNFVYRFVNDISNRIARFKRGGWSVVTDDLEVGAPRVGVATSEGTPVKVSVGRDTHAYLMKIEKEYYSEDQKAKAESILDTERAMDAKTRETGMYGEFVQS